MNDGFEYIHRLCDEALSGPWVVTEIKLMGYKGYYSVYGVSDSEGRPLIKPIEENYLHNMEFVAASRELVPQLLEAVKALDTIVQNYGVFDQSFKFDIAGEILDKLRR